MGLVRPYKKIFFQFDKFCKKHIPTSELNMCKSDNRQNYLTEE